MATNKHISKIIIALMAAAVILCILAIAFSDELTEQFGGTGIRMEYESELFDTDEIISINIQMDEEDWNDMLSNAMSEEYYVCDVTVNGKKLTNVGIRPKGNTSLSAIAMDPDSDFYSLKLEFDHFVEGQTCFDLDKLILNNNYADATNMKEAIVYDMYEYIGAEASLYNYAQVSVNGEYRGVYLALEAVEESFLLRNFSTQDGELYKPDSMEMGGGDNQSFSNKKPSSAKNSDEKEKPADSGDGSTQDTEKEKPSSETSSDGNGRPSGKGGFSMGGGGANLNYTDDDLDSYSTIWDGSVTDTGKTDHRRVITALKNISEGNDLETYLDVENILKYMAVHTFSVNMDSLSGSMAHNYYLYESDGRLNIFPWDYNLSFGGMPMGSSGDATSMVNDAIDTPFSGTDFFDALLSNDEYRAKYHSYLQQLVDEYVNGGRFDEVYNRIRSQIDPLVETASSASYSYEEYQTAAPILYETIKLRAESIEGQLNGTIPSTDEGQREDSSALIDASHIDVKAMGQFDMGGGFGSRSDDESNENASEDNPAETENPENPEGTEKPAETENPAETSAAESENNAAFGQMPGNMNSSGPPEGFNPGSLPEGFDAGNMPNGFDPGNLPEGMDLNNLPEGFDPGNLPDGFNQDTIPDSSVNGESRPDLSGNVPDGADAPSEMQSSPDTQANGNAPDSAAGSTNGKRPSFSGMPGQPSGQANGKNLITLGICLAAMLILLFVMNRIKRKKY